MNSPVLLKNDGKISKEICIIETDNKNYKIRTLKSKNKLGNCEQTCTNVHMGNPHTLQEKGRKTEESKLG